MGGGCRGRRGRPPPADCCPPLLDSPRLGSTPGFGVTGSRVADARAAECDVACLLLACRVFVRRLRFACLALVDAAPAGLGWTLVRFAGGVGVSVARAFSVS